ncbi:hypothetical protein GW17_00003691 [Ensete ventricosum]|nr:hypothetical protein GW17_00003691 [Ensete ventricosum]
MHERRCLLEDDDVDVRVFVKALVQPSCSIDRYYTVSPESYSATLSSLLAFPQFDAAGVGARYRVSPDLTPLMSVIRALSPRRRSTSESPAGANTRVAFLMLQLRDRATP